MITHSRRKREQKLRRKASVLRFSLLFNCFCSFPIRISFIKIFRKYKAKKWKKYGAKIKASWARREERRKALNEERKTSNDWFYYPEINFWIHRRHLENDHIRFQSSFLPSYTLFSRMIIFFFWFSFFKYF